MLAFFMIPKDVANAIWGACFDYKPTTDVIDGKTIEDRIMECWERLNPLLPTDKPTSDHIVIPPGDIEDDYGSMFTQTERW